MKTLMLLAMLFTAPAYAVVLAKDLPEWRAAHPDYDAPRVQVEQYEYQHPHYEVQAKPGMLLCPDGNYIGD